MMPRLEAEETLELSLGVTLGAGGLKPAERQRIARKLELQTRPEGGKRPAAKASPTALAMMGLGVRIAEPKKAAGKKKGKAAVG